MIKKIKLPKISKDFDMDDIRKIRDWHSKILKDATKKEIMDYFNKPKNQIYFGK
jgi:hypothetical protein